jgi:hypothetical protein
LRQQSENQRQSGMHGVSAGDNENPAQQDKYGQKIKEERRGYGLHAGLHDLLH